MDGKAATSLRLARELGSHEFRRAFSRDRGSRWATSKIKSKRPQASRRVAAAWKPAATGVGESGEEDNKREQKAWVAIQQECVVNTCPCYDPSLIMPAHLNPLRVAVSLDLGTSRIPFDGTELYRSTFLSLFLSFTHAISLALSLFTSCNSNEVRNKP